MAAVQHWFASWTSPDEGSDFAPGAAHYWWMTGFAYGDVVSVMAQSVVGDPSAPHRVLAVSDLAVDAQLTGGTLLFTVRNVGSSSTPGYGLGFSIISA